MICEFAATPVYVLVDPTRIGPLPVVPIVPTGLPFAVKETLYSVAASCPPWKTTLNDAGAGLLKVTVTTFVF
jgi:hypothetical protein